ncbi:MAG TPA: hypothetical protein EYH34_07045 [Planctomycetes bacterium]|nr:hypothetical protein [Planctomycetota bacterium]
MRANKKCDSVSSRARIPTWRILGMTAAAALLVVASASLGGDGSHLEISGIYPHLATFNQPADPADRPHHGECGIGAIAPWAGRLWYITYPQHKTTGSNDKLYEVDDGMNVTVRPESVGGTHACRMIHRQSNQLIIGPYFIDAGRRVRSVDLRKLRGRMTAVMRHLTDPANKVYFFDMEGAIYEVNVHSLEVQKLFGKPIPGFHGKGGYTAQGRVVIANNGESGDRRAYRHLLAGGPPASEDEVGALAQWDGSRWEVVERKQFTDVTGPGGIEGSPDRGSPLWAIGWDKRSVILKLLDGGRWYTFRLPKGSHTFDPRHGWFTEWPRIRQVAPGRLMMCMHGTLFDFPPAFSARRTGGIRPISTLLRVVPDFCQWNGRVVLGADDASMMGNPLCGQGQSNLWFGTVGQLSRFGPRSGWGGVWVGDEVEADQVSLPFLVAGYDQRVLHLAVRAGGPVRFRLEVDRQGRGEWEVWRVVTVQPPYGYEVLPRRLSAQWMRIRAGQPCRVTAYFHMFSTRPREPDQPSRFSGLVHAGRAGGYAVGLIRPAAHNRSLQLVARRVGPDGRVSKTQYFEVQLSEDGRRLVFVRPQQDRTQEVIKVACVKTPYDVDRASVILTGRGGRRYRLPKTDPGFDAPFPFGWPRGVREAVTERYLANIHGTFYEIPRAGYIEPDVQRIKPVCTHRKIIADFCTWRGLLVLSGVRLDASPDGHVFSADDGTGLWFGAIDDLWKLGKPVGRGGPWYDSPVKAGEPSDPYLMTGYDRKRLALSHDQPTAVSFTLEVDFDHRYWRPFGQLRVPPGKELHYEFPEGFHAHWIRLTADRDCRATAVFTYE